MGLMRIILIKLILYLTDKMPKKKKFTVYFPGKTPLKLKKNTPQNQTISIRTCCKHSRPLSYNNWPIIAILRQCTDAMATV